MTRERTEPLTIMQSCAAEIHALASVYEDVVQETAQSAQDAHIKKIQLQYAKERILKLSLHLKAQLDAVQQ